MDILVVRPDGSWYSRPDVTLVRDRDRFCLPDDCSSARACRCRVIRAVKAGKAVAPKFFHRYFTQWAPGVLFYGVNGEGGETPYLDRATWVDRESSPLEDLPEEETAAMSAAVERISRHLSLRIGDMICFEEGPGTALQRNDSFDNLLVI